MNVHVIQHVPFEGTGSIASWLEAQDAVVGTTRFYEPSALPSLSGLELVIAMGGPMGVNDEVLSRGSEHAASLRALTGRMLEYPTRR